MSYRPSPRRVRPAGLLRAFAALALGLSVTTCRDAFEPRSTVSGRVAVAPILPSEAMLADFGLTIDAVRFVVVRLPSDTLADTTLALHPDSTELALDLHVTLFASPETLSVSVLALSGTLPLFSGTELVPVPSGLPPTEIPVDTYIGPVADSIVIVPRSSFILLNDSLRFQVQGFNGGVAVTQFYIAWSSSDSAVAPINRFGVLRAPGTRAVVRVIARTPSGARDSVTATFTPPATQLVLVSGGGQTDTVGSPLATPLAVEARATDGNGVGGVAVRFRALSAGGTVADSLVVTDAAGRASTSATLGGGLGPQSFEASVTGLTGSPVTFNATALAGPPTQLLAAAGDAQVTTVATPVSTRPAVVLRDAGGNPVAGASVTFSAASGGGGITGGTQTTDASGAATVGSWTLGNLAGTNTLTASAAGLTRTFTATGVADSATQLVVTAGDLQSAPVGTAVATDPTVRAQDQFGNPVAGASITFAVSGGGGSVSGGAQLTNAAGTATVGGWTLGTGVGANALQANLSGVTPVTFTATGSAGAATAIVKIAGDLQSGIVNAALATPPRVRLVDQFGNPVAGASVTFAVAAGGGSVGGASQTTDTSGAATVGSWTLGTATGPNGLTATAGSLSATFNATGLAGAPAQIAVLAGDGQTALVNTLLPIAASVIVRDQFNNAVPGVGVTFVASGNGVVTGGSPTTDLGGVATVGSWRLAILAGPNTLQASAGALTASVAATGLAGAATQLLLNAGDLQSATVNAGVLVAPAVKAVDQFGNAVPGVAVHFAVTTGGGVALGADDTTGTAGIANVGAWTLGTIAGTNTLTATAATVPGSPVSFNATGLAGAAKFIAQLAGNGQAATVNTALGIAPTVRVTDQFGNRVAGASVTFAVGSGGGSLGGAGGVSTDTAGVATSPAWTIGTLVGGNSLTTTASGLTGSPVTFTATGTADIASQMVAFAGEGQTGLVGTTLSIAPAVRVSDQYGNAVAGVPVSFTVSGGGGSVLGASPSTDAGGVAVVGSWMLGSLAATNTLDATSAGLPGVTFTADGLASAAATIALNAGNGQSGTVNTALAQYAVLVTDGVNPVAGVPVSWAVTSGGGTITPLLDTTDAAGLSTAIRTLGTGAGTQTATASVGGLSGSPVVFTATGLADAPAFLVKRSTDPQTGIVATLIQAPVVEVTDQFGNPGSGVIVDFSLIGLGVLGATVDTTDGTGHATAVSWLLGSLIGPSTVTASASGLTDVTFTANAMPGLAVQVVELDGNGQTGTAGEPLPNPYRVRVADLFGNGVPDVTVNWSIGARVSGGIAPSSGPTDASGIAAAIHTLGNTVGPHSAFAWVTGIADTVTFTSTAAAGAAAQIIKQAGDTQTAIVNTAVGAPITVKVTDQFGAPVAGYSVSWAVASGGGSLGGTATVVSDTAGIATAPAWTLGTAAGSNGLNASAAGLTGSPVAFTAAGRAGVATQMAIRDGNNQSAIVATAVAIKPSVTLKDQFNNPVAGAQVIFAVLSGGGSVTGGTDTTDAQGIAVVGSWTLGTLAGPNALRASSAGVQPRTFAATGLAGAPVKLAFVTEPSRSLAGDTIEPPVRVAIQDQFGNTVLPVTDVIHLGLGATPDPAAKLLGTVDVAAVNGVAVFSELAIDSAGIGYTLLASTPKLAGSEESVRFDVGGVIAAFLSDRWEPVAAAFNPVTKLVYVPGLNNNVGVLDPGKSLTMVPGFQTPFGVAVNSVTNRIYVTTAQGVVVMNGQGNVIVATIAVGPNPKGIAVDEETNRIYVAVDGDPGKDAPPKLVPIDGSKNEVIVADVVPFPIGIAGIGVAFNPRDRLVYVAMPAPQEVWVIDPTPTKAGVVARVRNLGKFTYGVGVDGRNGLLFATNQDENTVSVIDISSPDPADFKEITRVPVGRLPQGIGVDEDRGMVYVANSGEATVSFIDGVRFDVIATLIVGPAPKAAAVNLGTGQFYVPTLGDDRLRVVQP